MISDCRSAWLAGGVVGVAARALGVEAGAIIGVERRPLEEATRQIRVGNEGATKPNRVRMAAGDHGVRVGLVVAARADEGTEALTCHTSRTSPRSRVRRNIAQFQRPGRD